MYIDRIEMFHVRLPLIYPWKTAYGEDADIHSVLFRMVSGDHEGWGETTPFATQMRLRSGRTPIEYNCSRL